MRFRGPFNEASGIVDFEAGNMATALGLVVNCPDLKRPYSEITRSTGSYLDGTRKI